MCSLDAQGKFTDQTYMVCSTYVMPNMIVVYQMSFQCTRRASRFYGKYICAQISIDRLESPLYNLFAKKTKNCTVPVLRMCCRRKFSAQVDKLME